MIELYKLTQGATTRATITSSPDDVTFGGETYKSTAVKRSRIIIRPDLLQNKITLQMSVHTMLGLDLLAEVNNNLSHKVTIYRGQDVASLSQIWAGSLTEQSCNGEVAVLTYGGGGIALRQLGDRRPFQRRCPFILYDELTCRAVPQTITGAVTSINATKDIVEVSGLDTHDVGYFTGGVLCPSATYSKDNADNSFVSSHNKTADADELRLTTPIDVAVGDSISVLAGCDRTWQTCYSKFSNIVNFGGFPFLPLENPYIAEVCSSDGVTAPTTRAVFSCRDTGVPITMSGDYAIMIAVDTSGQMYAPRGTNLSPHGGTQYEIVRDENITPTPPTPSFTDDIGTNFIEDNIVGYRSLTGLNQHGHVLPLVIAKRQINVMICQLVEAIRANAALPTPAPLNIDLAVVGHSGLTGYTTTFNPPRNDLVNYPGGTMPGITPYAQLPGAESPAPPGALDGYTFPLLTEMSTQNSDANFNMRPFNPDLHGGLIQTFVNELLFGQRGRRAYYVTNQGASDIGIASVLPIRGAYNRVRISTEIFPAKAVAAANLWFAQGSNPNRKNILIYIAGDQRFYSGAPATSLGSALNNQINSYLIATLNPDGNPPSGSTLEMPSFQTSWPEHNPGAGILGSFYEGLINTSGGLYPMTTEINHMTYPPLAEWRTAYGDPTSNPYLLKDIIERTT